MLNPALPVVGVSGHVGGAELEDCGFAAFMDRPLQLENFRQLVEDTLAQLALAVLADKSEGVRS